MVKINVVRCSCYLEQLSTESKTSIMTHISSPKRPLQSHFHVLSSRLFIVEERDPFRRCVPNDPIPTWIMTGKLQRRRHALKTIGFRDRLNITRVSSEPGRRNVKPVRPSMSASARAVESRALFTDYSPSHVFLSCTAWAFSPSQLLQNIIILSTFLLLLGVMAFV